MAAFDDYLDTFAGDPGYLNWAAFGPLSPGVRAEAFADADLLASMRPASHALVFDRAAQAREVIAGMLGADVDEVTVQPSSTHGLAQALYGLQGAVIASSAEFPSVSITLERAVRAAQGGISARWIAPGDGHVTPDAVAEALDEEVTALVVSHVDFRTGYRADLTALRELLGPDRLLIVDAVQSFGIVDEDYSVADVVAGHGYKWLRAGRGSGFARYSPFARERIRPLLSGVAGTTSEGLPVDALPPAAASARAFTVSAPDPLAAARLAVGAAEVRDAGVARIQERISAHVDEILEIADRHGVPVSSPRDPERRAGIVALAPAEPGRLAAALANADVSVTARGDTVRLAPHAGTGSETIRMLDDALSGFGNETFIGA